MSRLLQCWISPRVYQSLLNLHFALCAPPPPLQSACHYIVNPYVKQGGSVMCVCTLSSDPAHLHFSLNCLPNEEEIKKLTYQHIVHQTTERIKQSTLEGL